MTHLVPLTGDRASCADRGLQVSFDTSGQPQGSFVWNAAAREQPPAGPRRCNHAPTPTADIEESSDARRDCLSRPLSTCGTGQSVILTVAGHRASSPFRNSTPAPPQEGTRACSPSRPPTRVRNGSSVTPCRGASFHFYVNKCGLHRRVFQRTSPHARPRGAGEPMGEADTVPRQAWAAWCSRQSTCPRARSAYGNALNEVSAES